MQIAASDVFFWSVAALHGGMTLRALFHLQWARRLPLASAMSGGSTASSNNPNLKSVSIVLAARDEEARIESTIARLLAQRGIDGQVIAVNDRSKDRTGEILQRLAKSDSRLKVLHVTALPDGWLGKCYACHLGAAAATGDWILFTDADCWLKEDVISRALLVAEREHADHVTLTPGIAAETVGAQAWHLAFLISLCDWFFGVNRDRPKAYLRMHSIW